jgi:hypothetical protein
MPVHANKPAGSLSAKRAVAILLLTAASMLALGACTNSGRDYLNERPSSNYQRLPVR